MKNAKIVRVAAWDGWCGACAAERPLVLTRTGRQRLRTWLTGAADDSRPLVLTCRLCGQGVDVPLERDDPPPAEWPQERGAAGVAALTTSPAAVQAAGTVHVPEPALPVTAPLATGLSAARQDLAQALGALLARRAAAAPVPQPASGPVTPPVAAPVLPLQRTPSTGGLAELALLADGIDLLGGGRP